jgi:hypothetical protein
MKQITLNMPYQDEGALIEVQGLGIFPNRKTSVVEDEQYEAFIALGGDWPEGSVELILEPEEPVEEVEEPVETIETHTPVDHSEGAPQEVDE